MALSNLEKIKILRHLGWPAKTIDSASLSYSKIVSDRLTNLGADIEGEARIYLDRIAKLDEKLETALTRAGVTRVDDFEFSGDEITILRNEKRKLVREMATMIDVAILGGSSIMGNIVV